MLRRQMIMAAAGLAIGGRVARAKNGDIVADDIVLGHSGSLSGPMSTSVLIEGAQLAFAQSALLGGVHGRRVQVVALDDGLSPTKAVANYEELLGSKNALAMFACVGSDTTIAANKVLERHGATLVGGYAVSDSVREEVRRNAFFFRATVQREAQALVNHLIAIGIRDIGIAHMSNLSGTEAFEHVRAALESHKLQPAVALSINREANSLPEAAAAVAQRKPQALIMYLAGAVPGTLIRAIKEKGTHTLFYGMSTTSGELTARVAGEAARGLAICQVVPYPWSNADSTAKDFRRLAEANKVRVSYLSFEGYLSGLVVLDALKRAGPHPTRSSLQIALRNLRMRVSEVDLNFTGGRHTGSTFTEMVQVTVDGRFIR